MAQIIKHRRGSLEKLSEVTGSLQKGEIVIATGSANLTTTNGSALAFIVPESGSVQASNRFLMGSSNPAVFSASTYNGMLKGVPYYASGSATLFLLGSDGNEAINLVGNIQPFSGSVNTRLGDLEASIGGAGSGVGARVTNLETISASYLAFTSSYYTDSASVDTRLSASVASQTALSASIATTDSASAASVSVLSASIATSFSASAAGETALSASIATSFSASAASVTLLSASIATTDSASAAAVAALSTSVDTRLDALEFNDTRLATTGSNTFIGTQVITGSMYITNDLIVQGSSSLQNITASAVSIGTNTVVLNTATPAVRFGGISVADSGSGAGVSGSLFWDSLNNNWIYQHPNVGPEAGMSAMLISGPKNSGSLGDEVHITPGRIMVAVGDDHIGDSIMSQSAGKITLEGGLDVTGNISSSTITGIGNVTLYSQSVDSRVATLETSLGGGGSIGTRVGNLETISGSYLAFTQSYYTDSSSFDTRISASVAGYTANSASAATSFSASLASQTALSASIATTNNTQTDNISTVSASAWGAFQSASSYSGSIATSLSASKAEYTSFSASAATSFSASIFTTTANSASAATDFNTLSGSTYTQFSASAFTATANSASAATSFSASLATISANSASAATDFNTLSGSTYTQFSASAATVTANSASTATSLSASNAEIAAVSASVASTTGQFSGSVYTQFSASAATATANSASAASDFNTLSGSAFTQFSASAATVTANSASAATSFSASLATVTANSASAATSFSASLASQTALSASIATTDNAQTDKIVKLEASQSAFDTAIELTGSSVTIQGDLLVRGTTTSVNSTTIELGDNIIELNGSGASNGGLYVKDVTSPNTATGSLIWDSTNDYWKAGVKASESKVLLATGDNVFTSSIQTALSGTFGYSAFSESIATSFSASAASVATVTGTFSSSVATSFSASAATAIANSASAATDFNTLSGSVSTLSGSIYTQFSASVASVTANSASAATSFSASVASVTALSSSVDSRLDTLEGSGSIQGVGTSNNVSFSSVTASLNVPGGSSTKRLAFRGLTDNIEFIAAPTTAGDIAQWNGSDFVMSNVIDGGAF
jgi:hypothetical protein